MEQSPSSEKVIADLREAYAAFNRGDIDAALKPFDAQIEWSEPPEFPGGGMYRGLDGVKRYLTQSRAGLAEGSSEPERFIVAGNRIVVFVHAWVRRQGSEDWNDVKLADVSGDLQMLAFESLCRYELCSHGPGWIRARAFVCWKS